jgi:hypothetical protein
MTVTAASFIIDFPEFSNSTTYPTQTITNNIALAQNFVNANRWGALADYGVELWVAHKLSLSAIESSLASAGTPGAASGPVTAKSVGGVSKSMDVNLSATEGGGTYNLTSYGQEYLTYAMMFGAGGKQL